MWSEIPQLKGHHKEKFRVEIIWPGEDLGYVHKEYTAHLEAHDVAVLKVKGAC